MRDRKPACGHRVWPGQKIYIFPSYFYNRSINRSSKPFAYERIVVYFTTLPRESACIPNDFALRIYKLTTLPVSMYGAQIAEVW